VFFNKFLNTNTSYYIKIVSDLNWNLSFYGNWDNQQPPCLFRQRLWDQLGAQLGILTQVMRRAHTSSQHYV